MSKENPSDFSNSPALEASIFPFSDRSTSAHPVKRFSLFQCFRHGGEERAWSSAIPGCLVRCSSHWCNVIWSCRPCVVFHASFVIDPLYSEPRKRLAEILYINSEWLHARRGPIMAIESILSNASGKVRQATDLYLTPQTPQFNLS